MAEKYYVFHRCEDNVHFGIKSKEELKEMLEDENEVYRDYDFFRDPKNLNLENFPSKTMLIIKGEVIMPKPVKRVVEFEV